MASSEIHLKKVGFRVGEEAILKDINLHISSGETFVLVGPSGLGKSLLLKMIAGLLSPSTGEIYIGSQNLLTSRGKKRREIIRQMGMLFQKNALFDSLPVAENLAFAMREVSHLNSQERERAIQKYLTAVGLYDSKDLYPDEISGGMQKRLGIARALVLNPKILLFDDPTAGLDPITSRKIVELILQVKKDNQCTIVAITNDMHRAYQMADRIGLVVDHSLIVTGTVQETKMHPDPRVQQFIHGYLTGPLVMNSQEDESEYFND